MTHKKPKSIKDGAKNVKQKIIPDAEVQYAYNKSYAERLAASQQRAIGPFPTVKHIEEAVARIPAAQTVEKDIRFPILLIIVLFTGANILSSFAGYSIGLQSRVPITTPPAIKKYCKDYAGWYWNAEQHKCLKDER